MALLAHVTARGPSAPKRLWMRPRRAGVLVCRVFSQLRISVDPDPLAQWKLLRLANGGAEKVDFQQRWRVAAKEAQKQTDLGNQNSAAVPNERQAGYI